MEEPSKTIAKPRKTAKLPNLKSLKKDIKDDKNGNIEEVDELITEEEDIDELALRDKWNEFAEVIRKSGRESEYTTLQQGWILETDKIKMELTNSVQDLSMQKLQQDLTQFLRKNLRNKNISIEWEVKKEEQEKMIYTNKEKFEHLAEKNPNLRKLKERFDLDTDF